LYSRSIWAQNLLAPLALAWGYSAYIGLTASQSRRRNIAIAAHIFLAGFIVQVHFAGAGLALGTLYLFVRHRWWQQMKPVIIGAVLAIITLLPFVIEVACCAPQVADEFRVLLASPSQIDLIGFRELLRLAVGYDWGFLALGDVSAMGRNPLPTIMAGVVFSLGVVVLLRDLTPRPFVARGSPARKKSPLHAMERGFRGEVILIWLIVTPLFFVRHSTPVFIHYQLASLPAMALIVGASTRLFNDKRWRIGATVFTTLLAIVWSIALGDSLSRAGEIVTPNGLGTPLRVSRNAAYSVPDDAPVLFFTHGDDPNLDGEVAVFDALWWGREQRIVQGESVLILPPYPATLMATLEPFQAWEELQAVGLTDDVLHFPRRQGAQPFVAVRYDGVQSLNGFTMIEPVRFAHGVQLEGWRVRRVGPRLRISTMWRVIEQPPPGTFQQFHHLWATDTHDSEPMMISDVPLSNHNWQLGDILIVMGDFFIDDAGEFYVDVGQYTLPDVVRFSRLDGGDSVRLGPFIAR